jgi:hypothetical protein
MVTFLLIMILKLNYFLQEQFFVVDILKMLFWLNEFVDSNDFASHIVFHQLLSVIFIGHGIFFALIVGSFSFLKKKIVGSFIIIRIKIK